MRTKEQPTHALMYGYQLDKNSEAGHENAYNLSERIPSEHLSQVISALNELNEGSRVINLGCGDGILESHTEPNRRYSFTSIDLEPAAIQALRQTFEQTSSNPDDLAIVGSITSLDTIPEVQDSQFDAAVSWRVLHGIAPEHYTGVFKNIRESLQSGASFFISVACDEDWKARALGQSFNADGINDCSGVMFRDHGVDRENPFPIHFFSADEILELGCSNGFRPVAFDTFEEESGYAHLKEKPNTYHFVHFVAE